ncbi:MAG: efflux RND transporter permease subunit [Candidatus Brocadiae bacterium]|nr:efflux RND transporter permease subunit [Candidatus Brocadiia bacterium]
MKISQFSVRRPIFMTMSMLMVLLLGGISLLRLPIDLMPDISYPTLTISTNYENVSPEEIEELITRPIEEAVVAVPGVEEMTSVSTEGVSQIRVSFSWGTNLDAAASDVRDRLDRVVSRLPDDAERPTLRKFDLASFPIMILGAYSGLNPVEMRKIIEDDVKYRLERVPGIASLDITGGPEREIHVNFYEDKVKALGLSIDQLRERIRAENSQLPAGQSEKGNYEVTIRTQGEYKNLDQIRNTIVAIRDGVPIQVREVADVKDHWQKIRQIVLVNGKPGLRMRIYKQSGANTVESAKGVLEELKKISEEIPQIHIVPIIDTSDYIQRSITNVGDSAVQGGLFAVFILLFFLRSIRSTIIISIAIPISIISTFALMYFNHFTLNLMTLGGLALGVGMLVDNSIVVLENIYRLHETGLSPEKAAILGAEQVTAPIMASTLTTLAVFLPLIFVRGMAGIMFQQLAYIVSFSLLCSLVVALTLVPMLAAKMLDSQDKKKDFQKTWRYKFFEISGYFLTFLEESYKDLLAFSLHYRILIIIATLLLLWCSLYLYPMIGVEFMPESDESEVRVDVEMEIGTRLELVQEKFAFIDKIVRENIPELKSTVVSIGGTPWRPSGTHTGEMRIVLNPMSMRERSSQAIAAALRKKLTNIPGCTIRTKAGQGFFLLRMGSDLEKVQIEIRGHDLEVSDAIALQVKKSIEKIEGITDVILSRESGGKEETIIIDRQKAANMKLTVSQIANMFQTIFAGSSAGYYREQGDEYKILVKLENSEKKPLQDILNLTINNADGEPIVLRNVVHTASRLGPVRINRKDQERIVTIAANTAMRDLGAILDDVRQELNLLAFPQGFSPSFGGDYKEQQKSFQELMYGFILALILVYMVMACQYESLRDPFIVIFSVPFAAIGVLVVLFLTDTTFNVQSFIGCIMLGGIVVNNAILLVDQINALRDEEKMPMYDAIAEAGKRRLRPILMTTLTTILGLIPLALGIGEGSEAQAPLARSVIGGLSSSTLITLIFIPLVYSFLSKKSRSAPVTE